MRWNHPNHLAGFLAELAEAVTVKSSAHWHNKMMYWDAAIALRRAGQRVWSKDKRRALAARLGRLLGRPVTNNGLFYPTDEEERHGGWFPSMQRLLVEAATATLIGQQPKEDKAVTSAVGHIRLAGFGDAIDKIELKWRIRDWLALTDVTNVPPNIRLAAAAAWEGGHRPVAHQIVMEAAMGGRRGW